MTFDTGITVQDIETFLMILIRIASFMTIAPFFNTSSAPMRIKLGLSVFLAMLVQGAVSIEVPEYHTIGQYSLLIIQESVAGLLIGLSAYLCSSTIFFAGRMIDMEIGMSMASMFDATTRTQVSVSGNLYNYLLLLFFVISDMHHFLLGALVDSFQVIPIGGVNLSGLYGTMIGFFADYFSIGLRIMLPIFAVALIMNVVLALLAKVSPQMNMFAIGIQLKVLVGLGVLFLLAGSLPTMTEFVFDRMRFMVSQTIKGMM